MKTWMIATVLAPSIAVCVAAADLQPLGPEFVVTSLTNHHQNQPWVECDDDGNFVISYSLGDVFGRILDRDGNPLTNDFVVNPTLFSGTQDESFVTVDKITGDFMICYSDRHGNDGYQMGIAGRFYRADGTPYGPEFIFNTHTDFSQFEPHACFAPTGKVLVVWTDAGTDGSAGVIGRLFDRTGEPLTGEVLINEPNTFTQINPNVACDRNGNFVVAYVDASGFYGQPREILARRVDPDGNPIGAEFNVNTTHAGMQRVPMVAVDHDGDFTIVWQDESGNDGNGWGVFARMYDKNGTPKGPDFSVCSDPTGNQSDPYVSMDYVGNFIVTWVDDATGSFDVQARRFDRNGVPLGPDFTVHQPAKPNGQTYPKVVVSQSGQRFIGVWYDFDSDTYARLFELPAIQADQNPTIGQTTTFTLEVPGMADQSYLLLPSLSTGPGIGMTGQRVLDLGFDPVLVYGISVPNGPIFSGLAGTLDATGKATATFTVPNNANAIGASISFALLTYVAGDLANVEFVSDTVTYVVE